MNLKAFSIRDAKTEHFNTPFFAQTIGEAERTFKTAINDPKTSLNQYPEDYDLYQIGEYEDQKGQFSPLKTPNHLVKGVMLLNKPAQQMATAINAQDAQQLGNV